MNKKCVKVLLMASILFGAMVFTTTGTAHGASVARGVYAATTCPATIAYGSTGSLVTQLQTALVYNASFANLSIDGQFGQQTQSAVIAFQKAAFPNDSSQWDGIVGPHTWAELGFCHSSGGVSGGGCTGVHAASACVSVDSQGNVINDGYVGISNISYIELTIVEDGASYPPCHWSNGNNTFFVGEHLSCGHDKYGSGHNVESVIYGWDTSGNVFRVVSPVQYT